jgi:hypothetical protein
VAEERKYPLVRLGPGDYLLLGNDGETLWRIYAYCEDGSLESGGKTVVGRVWATSKYARPVRTQEDVERVTLEWDHWQHWAGPFTRRSEAVDDAFPDRTVRP